MPLLPESLDLVFCVATLHHASDLPLLMRNIQRVLKRGGILCAIGELCITIDHSAKRVVARDAGSELKQGIDDQRPNLLEYWGAPSRAGFEETNFIWPPGYRLSTSELTNCGKDLGAMHPAWSLKRWGFYPITEWRRCRTDEP